MTGPMGARSNPTGFSPIYRGTTGTRPLLLCRKSVAPLNPVQGIVEDINGDDVTWELGADYNHPIGKNARFTGLFIRTNSDTDRTT